MHANNKHKHTHSSTTLLIFGIYCVFSVFHMCQVNKSARTLITTLVIRYAEKNCPQFTTFCGEIHKISMQNTINVIGKLPYKHFSVCACVCLCVQNTIYHTDTRYYTIEDNILCVCNPKGKCFCSNSLCYGK